MSIQPLPQAAVHAIGSSQALNDPASVVKELIDNALDARATSVSVELSPDTLHAIQVRDNGHGIAPGDRAMVAKRHCTSKIENHTDILTIGGSYLGFRGEALSSTLEMSNGMTITTRIEGEEVGTSITISPQGEVDTEQKVSHPVGTTVRIAGLLLNHPVRKQIALKGTAKTFNKVKQMIKAYAFARPRTRFSLRVLQSKADRDNWTYAPKTDGDISETALKIIGKPSASLCVHTAMVYEDYSATALVPRLDTDVQKLSGLGQYISIDGRPVTSARGMGRQFVRNFKELSGQAGLGSTNNMFLYLGITCPAGSYDPNIEPAKDNVLFEDSEKVLSLVRNLFLQMYPVKDHLHDMSHDLEEVQAKTTGNQGATARCLSIDEATIEVPVIHIEDTRQSGLSARRTPQIVAGLNAEPTPAPSKRRRTMKTNMYDLDEDDLELLSAAAEEGDADAVLDSSEALHTKDTAASSNPWVLAKISANTGKGPQGSRHHGLITPKKQLSDKSRSPNSPKCAQTPSGVDGNQNFFLTPRPSSPMYDHPADGFSTASGLMCQESNPLPLGRVTRNQHNITQRSLGLQSPAQQSVRGESFGQKRKAPEDSSGRTRPTQAGRLQKPFKSPLIDPERDAWFSFPETQRKHRTNRTLRTEDAPTYGSVADNEPVAQLPVQCLTPGPNNRDIRTMLSRHELEAAGSSPPSTNILEDRQQTTPVGFISALEVPVDLNSSVEAGNPRHESLDARRTRATVHGRGTAPHTTNVSQETTIIHGDNHSGFGDRIAHLPTVTRRTTSNDVSKPRRTKSEKLPLERVPLDARVQNVIHKTSADYASIARAQRLVEAETFLTWTSSAVDLRSAWDLISNENLSVWSGSLKRHLVTMYPDRDFVQGLDALVRDAMIVQSFS